MAEERRTQSIVRDNKVTDGGTITVITAGGDVGAPDPWVTEFRAELDKARSLLADLSQAPSTAARSAAIAEANEVVEELDGALADPKKHRMSIKGLIPVLGKYGETIGGLGAIVAAIEEIARHL